MYVYVYVYNYENVHVWVCARAYLHMFAIIFFSMPLSTVLFPVYFVFFILSLSLSLSLFISPCALSLSLSLSLYLYLPLSLSNFCFCFSTPSCFILSFLSMFRLSSHLRCWHVFWSSQSMGLVCLALCGKKETEALRKSDLQYAL